jgi:ribosome-binding factor A
MKNKESGRSQRQLRIAEQIRHALVETLQRGKFNEAALIDAAPLVTVAEVRLTSDLKNATAYISPLGQDNIEEILDALNKSAYYFQKQVGRTNSLKFTPRIKFESDDTFAEAAKIDELLRNIPKYADEEE